MHQGHETSNAHATDTTGGVTTSEAPLNTPETARSDHQVSACKMSQLYANMTTGRR